MASIAIPGLGFIIELMTGKTRFGHVAGKMVFGKVTGKTMLDHVFTSLYALNNGSQYFHIWEVTCEGWLALLSIHCAIA